jgi:hypothetical protein
VGEVQASSAHEPSAGRLAAEAVVQMGGLLGQEMALAKAELRANGRHLGMGGSMLATAGFLGGTAWLVMLAAAIAGIAVVLPVWAAALIVGGALGLAGGGAALIGGRRLARGMPPLPVTTANVRRDLKELREKARR